MSALSIPEQDKRPTLKKLYFNLLLHYLCFSFLFYLNTKTNDTFSVQQASQTGNLAGNLITRQYKLDLMARSMEKLLSTLD